MFTGPYSEKYVLMHTYIRLLITVNIFLREILVILLYIVRS